VGAGDGVADALAGDPAGGVADRSAVAVHGVGDAAVPVNAHEDGAGGLAAVVGQALAPGADGAGGGVGAVGHAERAFVVDLGPPDLDGQAFLDFLEVCPVEQPQFGSAGGEGEAEQEDGDARRPIAVAVAVAVAVTIFRRTGGVAAAARRGPAAGLLALLAFGLVALEDPAGAGGGRFGQPDGGVCDGD
jgi:hypothetical protein